MSRSKQDDEAYALSSNLKPRNPKHCKKGPWTIQQNREYASYLEENLDLFQTENARRSQCVFKILAKHLKRRSPVQCRSHHQKMKLKYGTVVNIIRRLKKKRRGSSKKQQIEHRNEQKPKNRDTSQKNQDQPKNAITVTKTSAYQFLISINLKDLCAW